MRASSTQELQLGAAGGNGSKRKRGRDDSDDEDSEGDDEAAAGSSDEAGEAAGWKLDWEAPGQGTVESGRRRSIMLLVRSVCNSLSRSGCADTPERCFAAVACC